VTNHEASCPKRRSRARVPVEAIGEASVILQGRDDRRENLYDRYKRRRIDVHSDGAPVADTSSSSQQEVDGERSGNFTQSEVGTAPLFF
jgi:hypothetical protein